MFRSLILGLFVAGSPLALAAGDVAAGKAAASQCTACHGADGKGGPMAPAIAAMPAEQFIERMRAYKSGERKHQMMGMIAGKLDDGTIQDLAAYYATLK